MGVKVVQLTSRFHQQHLLSSLDQLRLQGQLNDVTVQVDYQGDVQEFQAHQLMLAASSGYFKKLLLSQDAAARDRVQLSNMHSGDFSKFLEFVYTGKVEVVRDKVGDVQAVARLLDCEDLADVCGEAMSAGILQRTTKRKPASKVAVKGEKKRPKGVSLKRRLSPQSSDKEVIPKRKRTKGKAEDKKQHGRILKLRLAGRQVLQRRLDAKMEGERDDGDGGAGEDDAEAPEEKRRRSSFGRPVPDVDWECEEDGHSSDPEDSLLLSLGEEEGEEEEEEGGQAKKKLKSTSKAQFQCNKCQRTFHYERSYLKHISTYHGVKADLIYRCETCQQSFANRSNMKIHEKHVHSSERLFACDICEKTFKRKKDVVRHQRQVHEPNDLRHVCPACGKALSSRTALLLHERTHTGAKPFECTDCSSRFSQNSALKMHRRTHTGEKPFACDECEARFTQKHILAYHKRSHTGEKPFMCESCGKSFASKEYLRHHSNIHTGSKPYKCQQCGRGFAQRNSLHQHLKTHTGERPYGCQECEKQFTQLNALQRHQRIHTGEKPYMCGLCRRTFTDKSTLRRHTLIHDSDAPWKTYLVVLEGNVEDKKTKTPTKGKTEKAGGKERKSTPKKGAAGTGAADADSFAVPSEAVTLPSDWTGEGTIALVSQGALGGIAIFHTEMAPGAQIQPAGTADATGAGGGFCLDGSALPFSMPAASVLEEAASQTILAPPPETTGASEAAVTPPDIQTGVGGDEVCGTGQTADGERRADAV